MANLKTFLLYALLQPGLHAELSDTFIQNITGILQAKTPAWLAQLPTSISLLSDRWQLHNLKTVPNLSYNYVAHAHSNSYAQEVVLKICILEEVFTQEYNALRYFSGKECVKLLDIDTAHNAILLESIKPGISLKSLWPERDLEAVEQTAALIQKIHQRPIDSSADFPHVAQRLELLNGFSDERIPQHHITAAYDLSLTLLASQGDLYVLHGDLHHENVLLGPNNCWKAIDPQGIVGELAYEVGVFMRNPFPDLLAHHNAKEILSQRLDRFSALLNIDRQRLIEWSYVQAVQAACWALRNNSAHWDTFIQYAELMRLLTGL